ncbi:hypothetical protein [Kitasatospora sp. LaBMicrA B282]|uniref:hypothetical protein n=1 Tax=Kitasatospora sp. LaBMicrA B282 TaxID=3420949 RepID=UPI003D0A58C1
MRLVAEADGRNWVRDLELPFAPFPGLGVRVDTYEVLNVVTVLVDAADGAVTCTVAEDGGRELTAKKCASLGFAEGAPAGARAVPAVSAPVRVSVLTFAEDAQWSRQCTLPFAPFDGLRIRLDGGMLLKVFTIVAGSSARSEVECYAGFEGPGADAVTEDDCEALGFERDYR